MQKYINDQSQSIEKKLFKDYYIPTGEQIQVCLRLKPENFTNLLGEQTRINFRICANKTETLNQAHKFIDKLNALSTEKNITCPHLDITWLQLTEDNPNSMEVYHREKMPDGSVANFGIFKDGGQACFTTIPTQCYAAMIEHDRAVDVAQKSVNNTTFETSLKQF